MEEERIKLEPFQFIRFSTEAKYFGTLKDKKFNGIGMLKRKTGHIYIGEFLKNKQDGLGIYKNNSGEEIIGEFRDNFLEGIGKISQKKNTYIGEVFKNQLYGVGEVIMNNGIRYRGLFNQGLLNGYGEIHNPKNESSTVGYFENGVIKGQGKEIYGGLTYYGNFENGLKSGKGIIVQNGKCVFKGNWKNGKKSGFCHYELSDFHYFDGLVEIDQRQGSGKLTDKANGIIYTGEYIDDLKHGFGRMEAKDFLYVGDWYRGKKEGLGYQKNYPIDEMVNNPGDGYSYFGFWKDGHKHGIGYETTPTREIKGEFRNGLHHGKAIIKPKGRKKTVYAIFKDGQLIKKIRKEECKVLFKTNLDINTFFKESKSRLEVIEIFIQDQKKKIYFNHREIKEKLDRDQVKLQHCIDRIFLHYIRIRNALLDLKEKLLRIAGDQITLDKDQSLDILPERFEEEIQLDHIFFNSDGEMRLMLESCKDSDDEYTFAFRNGCLHSKFPKDVDYGKFNRYSDFWSFTHPWLLEDEEKYSMIVDKTLHFLVNFIINYFLEIEQTELQRDLVSYRFNRTPRRIRENRIQKRNP